MKFEIYGLNRIFFVAPSSNQLTRAKNSALLKNKRIEVINNTLEIPNIILSKHECREILSLPKDKIIISFGAFNTNAKNKGIEYLIEALRIINLPFDIELVIFGKKLNHEIDVKYKIHNVGYSSDQDYLFKIFKASDLFISPSIEESFGLTICEAMSVGTPAISFEQTGVTDIIEHKKNGYLAKYKDTIDLAKGINWCLNNNLDGELSNYAIKKIAKSFSYDIIGKKFKKFYSELI